MNLIKKGILTKTPYRMDGVAINFYRKTQFRAVAHKISGCINVDSQRLLQKALKFYEDEVANITTSELRA